MSTISLLDLFDGCISDCNCDNNDYNPICLEESGLNFYSACAAGCEKYSIDKETNIVSYSDCKCLGQDIQNNFNLSSLYGYGQIITALKGECPSNDDSCLSSFYSFTAIMIFVSYFASSGRVGTLLLQLRAIEARDKVISEINMR